MSMLRRMRPLAAQRAVVAAVVVAGAFLPAGTAGADAGVPFHDPNANGFVALCDVHGHAMTSGRVDARPFAWTAISSIRPPAGYLGKGENAALLVYQPREGVDPADWSGDQLTGASFYSEQSRPAAQATYADLSLAAIVREFPPRWNGLYQLRMVFAKTGYGSFANAYSASVMQVTGDTWRLVSGGSLACRGTRSVSNESYVGIGTHPVRGTRPPVATPASAAAASAAGVGTSLRRSTEAGPPTVAKAAKRSGSPGYDVAGVAAAIFVALVTGLWWRRRRSRSHPLLTISTGPAADTREVATSGRTSAR